MTTFESTSSQHQSGFRSRLQRIGAKPDDSFGTRARKLIWLLLTLTTCVGALLWAVILFRIHAYPAAWVPTVYLALTITNVGLFHRTGLLFPHSWVQLMLGLLLPFVCQVLIGGYLPSGIVCMWGLLSLIGVIYVHKGRYLLRWSLLFMSLCLVVAAIDPFCASFTPPRLTASVSAMLGAINLVCITGMASVLAINNIKRERRLRGNLDATIAELGSSMQLLQTTQQEVAHQNELIAEKSALLQQRNEYFATSMRYAERIQRIVLPDLHDLSAVFQDAFIFYRPLDQVGGDFYWFGRGARFSVMVVADCTGHGVPGALLTIFGSSMLDQIVTEAGECQPDRILSALDRRLGRILNQDKGSRDRIPDGMEIAVIALSARTQELYFAGARLSLYQIHQGQLVEYKGDRFPIGDNSNFGEKVFTTHTAEYHGGDMVYLSTDGFPDQFGGPDNKKYMKGRMKSLLQQLAALEMREQAAVLEREFGQWKGEEPQTDDVLVLGARLL